jgi:hypothetical protein
MSDTIGLTTLPIAAPALSTDVVGDIALQRLGEFLRAAINRMGNTAWRTRGSTTGNVVEHVFCRNPARLFDESRLPALYLWRASSNRRREADDVLKVVSTIRIYWVSEPAQAESDTVREPFEYAVDRMIAKALYRERDSAWVVAGDTDPLAATQGSFLPTWLGYNWALKGDANELSLVATVTDGDGSRNAEFFGLATSVELEELTTIDTTIGTYPAALDAAIIQGGREAGAIYEPTGDLVFFDEQHVRFDGASVTFDV